MALRKRRLPTEVKKRTNSGLIEIGILVDASGQKVPKQKISKAKAAVS